MRQTQRRKTEVLESGKNSAARIAELEAEVADLTAKLTQLENMRYTGKVLAALCFANSGSIWVPAEALAQVVPGVTVSAAEDHQKGGVLFWLGDAPPAAASGAVTDGRQEGSDGEEAEIDIPR